MSGTNTYLVTGGCGFIGSHLVEALTADGNKVRILDNLSTGYLKNIEHIEGDVEFIEGDVRNADQVDSAAEGVRYIFHEAALVSVFDSVNKPMENHEINITGTLNVLQAARAHQVKRVVVASSAAVYGNNPDLPKQEQMLPEPESPYAIGKIAGEYYFRVFSRLYDVETVSLRYFNVYGPRQDPTSMYSGVISKFSDVLSAGGTPLIFGDGEQTRDFVFVKDVVAANLLAMHSPNAGAGEAFNVGTGTRSSLLELLSILQDLTGNQNEPEFKEARAGDIKHSVSDISRAREVLGYEPVFDLKRGLAELMG